MRPQQEFRLDTLQGGLAGLSWRLDSAPRVLCLHGWLDNAASFVPLAPLLDRLDLVALDLPGHGHSEHRHSSTRYHFIDYLFNVDAALDALGWADCHLLGHSLGAAISAVYSAGAPERVRSIVMLDTMGPISVTAEGTTKRLRRSLFKNRRGYSRVRRFDSIEEMVKARCSVSDLSPEAARLICERAARQTGTQFEWRSDPALNWVSSLVMTDEQAMDLESVLLQQQRGYRGIDAPRHTDHDALFCTDDHRTYCIRPRGPAASGRVRGRTPPERDFRVGRSAYPEDSDGRRDSRRHTVAPWGSADARSPPAVPSGPSTACAGWAHPEPAPDRDARCDP